jgi:hypothetical protein
MKNEEPHSTSRMKRIASECLTIHPETSIGRPPEVALSIKDGNGINPLLGVTIDSG